MATAVLDVRCNIDGLGLNRIANDGFETDTAGWLVSAGIQGAATTITRTTGGSPWMGLAVGRLTTTSTSGSGCKYVMASTFTSGITYRFRVYLKYSSGATTCGIRIGSLGTAGDRAVSTFTVTGTWTAYQVDFTPTGNRSDIQVNVYTNSAASMVVDIDAAEVYAVSDDLTPNIDTANWTHGANFEGGLSAGSATLTLHNEVNQYSDGATRLTPGMPLLIRSTYAGIPYGNWYGIVKRATGDGSDRRVTVQATDVVDSWDRSTSQDSIYSTVSIGSARGVILVELGLASTQRNLSLMEAEADRPFVGYDRSGPLDVLASFDRSTGTLSFLRFDPSTSVLYVYTTLARNQRSARTPSETLSTNITSISAEINEDVNLTDQRVNFTTRESAAGPDVVWLWAYNDLLTAAELAAGGSMGIHLDDGQVLSGVASIVPAELVALVVMYSGSAPTQTSSGGVTSITWSVTGGTGAGTDIAALYIHGRPFTLNADTVLYEGTTSLGWHVLGPDIAADFVPSRAAAEGLAAWITEHTPGLVARYDVTVEGLFPTQVARQVGDLINLTPSVLSAATVAVVIRSLTTTVTDGGATWSTNYLLDVAGNPTASGAFLLDASVLNGSDTLGY